jgi:hypothetical protein
MFQYTELLLFTSLSLFSVCECFETQIIVRARFDSLVSEHGLFWWNDDKNECKYEEEESALDSVSVVKLSCDTSSHL